MGRDTWRIIFGHAPICPRSMFSTLFARGLNRCGLWLPVYCSNLLLNVADNLNGFAAKEKCHQLQIHSSHVLKIKPGVLIQAAITCWSTFDHAVFI